jgi:hypothetical protein
VTGQESVIERREKKTVTGRRDRNCVTGDAREGDKDWNALPAFFVTPFLSQFPCHDFLLRFYQSILALLPHYRPLRSSGLDSAV